MGIHAMDTSAYNSYVQSPKELTYRGMVMINMKEKMNGLQLSRRTQECFNSPRSKFNKSPI